MPTIGGKYVRSLDQLSEDDAWREAESLDRSLVRADRSSPDAMRRAMVVLCREIEKLRSEWS